MKLRHLRPFAAVITPQDKPDVDVAAHGAVDEDSGAPLDVFDVADVDLAASLLDQPDNFEPADDEAAELLRQLGELAGTSQPDAPAQSAMAERPRRPRRSADAHDESAAAGDKED